MASSIGWALSRRLVLGAGSRILQTIHIIPIGRSLTANRWTSDTLFQVQPSPDDQVLQSLPEVERPIA